jgi:hypothetical protein
MATTLAGVAVRQRHLRRLCLGFGASEGFEVGTLGHACVQERVVWTGPIGYSPRRSGGRLQGDRRGYEGCSSDGGSLVRFRLNKLPAAVCVTSPSSKLRQ